MHYTHLWGTLTEVDMGLFLGSFRAIRGIVAILGIPLVVDVIVLYIPM